jgi:hypothetical protein
MNRCIIVHWWFQVIDVIVQDNLFITGYQGKCIKRAEWLNELGIWIT